MVQKLIVHGLLHPVGYNQIGDDIYELMVVREDELLVELTKQLGDRCGTVAGDAKQQM